MRCVNDVAFNHHIFVDEVRREGVVGDNTAHLRRRQIHLSDIFAGEEIVHLAAIQQVEFVAAAQNQIHVAALLKLSDDGRAHHSPVARHKNTLSGHTQDSSAIATS